MEEWRDVVGYESVYSVSSLGRVRRKVNGEYRSRFRSGHVRTGLLDRKTGYYRVALTVPNGKTKTRLLHRVVMASFAGPCPEGYEVNHKNGDKSDNRFSNLEYVTPSQNCRHARAMGLAKSQYGTRHPMAKLNPEKIAYARKLRLLGEPYTNVAFLLGVTPMAVHHALSGKTWKQEVPHV